VHPDYKDQLREYLERMDKNIHEPMSLSMAFAMHRKFRTTGDMRNINWQDYRD
jgi:acyl-CoA hydrolase